MNVLYRKYRPGSFSSVVGQDSSISLLKESILSDKLSHAYLFTGPRGTGKTSTARLFAKAINCLKFKETGDICNECINCTLINQGSTDIQELDAASNRGIEDIRELRANLDYLPTALKKKVFIIDEVHMLTKEAFNALLKSLEEPPEHVVFILATTEAHKVPITILSRVQRFDFSLAKKEDLVKKLSFILEQESVVADLDAVELVAELAYGSFRDSESLLSKIISGNVSEKVTYSYIVENLNLPSTKIVNDFLTFLLDKNESEVLNIFNNLSSKGLDVNYFLDNLVKEISFKIPNEPKEQRLELINFAKDIFELKEHIRFISDKYSILRIYIAKWVNGYEGREMGDGGHETRVQRQETRDKKQEPQATGLLPAAKEEILKSSDVIKQGEKKIEPVSSGSNNVVDILNSKLSPRGKIILRSSKVIIEESKVIITNKYKFNLDLLKKEIGVILKTADSKEFEISFTSDVVAGQEVQASSSVIENNNETISDNTSKRDVKIDNSEVIKDIFNF